MAQRERASTPFVSPDVVNVKAALLAVNLAAVEAFKMPPTVCGGFLLPVCVDLTFLFRSGRVKSKWNFVSVKRFVVNVVATLGVLSGAELLEKRMRVKMLNVKRAKYSNGGKKIVLPAWLSHFENSKVWIFF